MPPQHSVGARLSYIAKTDPAWNAEMFGPEIDELEGEAAAEHPVVAYFQGETRYDLNAPGKVGDAVKTAAEYLRADVKPRVWLWRRLKIGEMSAILDMPTAAGRELAFRIAVIGLENPPEGVSFNPSKKGRALPESQMEEIVNGFGTGVVYDVGEAIIRGSRGPSSAEKK